jgi:carboxyl-terminal processing protease
LIRFDWEFPVIKERKTRPEISHMMRKISPALFGAAIGVAVTLTATQSALWSERSQAHAAPTDGYRQLSLFGLVFERVRAEYVDKPEEGKLVQFAINGMLSGLDPHSGYMDAKGFRNMQVDTRGEFGGIGIEVTMEEGLLKVVAPIDETPAARAGIMSNDIITHLDSEPVQGLTLEQASRRCGDV